MENNLIATIGIDPGGIPARMPPQLDKSFVEALSAKKIKEASPGEVLEAVSAAVEKVWFDRQLKPADEGDLKQLKINITKDFISCFGSLTLGEIGNCFHHWARGKYRKFYSVNVIEASQAMSDYLVDQTRLEAVRSIQPKELPAPKPGKEQLFSMDKSCLWIALEKHKQNVPLGTLAPPVYDFLNKLGLIIYSKADKWAFLANALLAVIAEQRIRIVKETDESKLSGLKKQLNLLLAANEPDAQLTDRDCVMLVKNKAKELSLADWLCFALENELDINELVESKRGNYETT